LEVLKKKGAVLIFSEGVCKNEPGLRPLKKGTARLAYMAFNEKPVHEVSIVPVSISYSSFTAVPLNVRIKAGKLITPGEVTLKEPALFYNRLNEILEERLRISLLPAEDVGKVDEEKSVRRMLLGVPAFIGWLTHKALYSCLKKLAQRKTSETVFYHSVLFGLLLVVYPVVLLTVTSLLVILLKNHYLWLLLILLPLTAWCYKEYKS
jgi:hypothetical protein